MKKKRAAAVFTAAFVLGSCMLGACDKAGETKETTSSQASETTSAEETANTTEETAPQYPSELDFLDNDDVKEAAASLFDQEYAIYELNVRYYLKYELGDMEYPYDNGVYAELYGYSSQSVTLIFEADEEIFDKIAHCETDIYGGTLVSVADDESGSIIEVDKCMCHESNWVEGQMITRNTHYELDTDTGVMTVSFEDDLSSSYDDVYSMEITDLDTIEDEDIRAVAESYMDEGYVLSTFDPYSTFYMYDYGYRGGFSGMYQDSTGFIEVWYFEGDEDLFERVDIPYLFGTETDRQDDGTLITITYVTTVVGETVEEQPTTLCYDRETGFITITSVYSNC